MKMQLLLVVATLASGWVQDFAQGTIRFNNRVPGLVDAPVRLRGTEKGVGSLTGAMAQLYLIPPNGPIVRLYPAATFRTSSAAAQYYVLEPAEPVVVPNAPPGTTVYIQMRVWVGGATYEAATMGGESNVIPVTLGGGTPNGSSLSDAVLVGLQSFLVGFDERNGW